MTRVGRTASPPSKPVLIFDGDCNFCRRWISRWRESTADRVEYIPLQDPSIASRFPELPRAQCEQSVQLVDTDGAIYSAAEAVFRSLACAPRHRWSLWLYQRLPGVSPVTESFYRFVAKHRTGFSFFTRMLWGQHVEQPSHFLTRWLFLRLLGLAYLFAFLSLWTQVDGLIGSHGITPAAHLMDMARAWAQEHTSWDAHWQMPTLCWFSASDSFLHALCAGGTMLSLLVIFGIAPAPSLALLWLFYLSLSVVSDVFLGYQWDALLLETGLLAIFFAPLQLGPGLKQETPPSRIMLWLLRWLLFRLMFASGVVKLATHDPTWRNFTALTFHYETQPLPTWIAWYANQLPLWFQKFSCAVMFAIELGTPFLIFTPRRLRFIAAGAITFLMLCIALTGNYCFFNLLTIALCALLLDDAALRRFIPSRWRDRRANPGRLRWPAWITAPLAVVVMSVTTMTLAGAFQESISWPAPMVELYGVLSTTRSFNGYGLFASMTTTRPEIIIEGSNDAKTWLPYEFKYKPGDVMHRPQFVEPFQPRLDWQMWFEALRVGNARPSQWFLSFCEKLLQGQPEVLALLKTNPFPNSPPRYIRATVYDYHFTNFAQRHETGAWWRRTFIAPYYPVLSLRTGPPDN
ncbi:MAG TPA: lipase maturation factor family protein [Verrucomicrobiae bacterium]|nr:lipase maturation factor family protein [Verrucomicrobiae bacterium]